MGSDIKNYQHKQFMTTVMTVIIMTAIIGIVTVARGSLKTAEGKDILAISANIELIKVNGLNETEKSVLAMLYNWTQLPDQTKEAEDNTDNIYFDHLKEYLSSSGVQLDKNSADEIEDLIVSGNKIMDLEKGNDLNKMSLDGKEVAIYIYERIYNLCGLKLTFDTESDIDQIVDSSGKIIYQKEEFSGQSGFRIDVLVVTLSVIFVLLALCIIIAKKNQLLIKGERYDGFDEKKYA